MVQIFSNVLKRFDSQGFTIRLTRLETKASRSLEASKKCKGPQKGEKGQFKRAVILFIFKFFIMILFPLVQLNFSFRRLKHPFIFIILIIKFYWIKIEIIC